jgi:hypothetical protein
MKKLALLVLLALSSLVYCEILSEDFLGIRLGMDFADAEKIMLAEAEKNGIPFYRAGIEDNGIVSTVIYRGNYRLKDADNTVLSVIEHTQQVCLVLVLFKGQRNYDQLIRLFREGLERRYRPTRFVKPEAWKKTYRMDVRGMRISVLEQGFRDVVVGAVHIRLQLAVDALQEMKKKEELNKW